MKQSKNIKPKNPTLIYDYKDVQKWTYKTFITIKKSLQFLAEEK